MYFGFENLAVLIKYILFFIFSERGDRMTGRRMSDDMTDDHGQLSPKRQRTSLVICDQHGSQFDHKLLWQVRNREDYNPPALYHPYDVKFLREDGIAVVEGFWPYGRIQIFSMNGRSVRSIGGGTILPFGVCVMQDGNIAITDHHERTVKMFDVQGAPLLSWSPDLFDWPNGIQENSQGHLIIADWSKGHLCIHDKYGQPIRIINTAEQSNSVGSCPQYMTTDNYNRIIMTDTFDRSVKIFDQSGQFLQQFGQEENQLTDPRGVCIDSRNNILVADCGSDTVHVYSSDGRYISKLLSAPNVQHPWGLATNGGLLVMTEQKLKGQPALKLYDIQQ
jgi:hypothetical protein